ncbi:cxxc_20_cxxc protein [Gracilibacillus orientalis]|uniref:Cxxc_20_cxxc protein n=1 Tax=Gracilibacillus orientalis TaxID=334253 RepID=A0A1I4IXC1_9BACI|nr:cxxc_20_cxxc protein [Gracilibacillus orientalis]
MKVERYCTKCKKQFSWREVQKSTRNLFIRPEIECSDCGEEYKITILSYILEMFFRFIPILVFYFLMKYDTSNGISLIVFLVIGSFTIFIAPFFVRYVRVAR